MITINTVNVEGLNLTIIPEENLHIVSQVSLLRRSEIMRYGTYEDTNPIQELRQEEQLLLGCIRVIRRCKPRVVTSSSVFDLLNFLYLDSSLYICISHRPTHEYMGT